MSKTKVKMGRPFYPKERTVVQFKLGESFDALVYNATVYREVDRNAWVQDLLYRAVEKDITSLKQNLRTSDVIDVFSNPRVQFLIRIDTVLAEKIDKAVEKLGITRTLFIGLAMLCELKKSVN